MATRRAKCSRRQPVVCVVQNGGTLADRAVDSCGTRRTCEARIRSVDSIVGTRQVEEACISVMVLIDVFEDVQPNASHIVSREHRSLRDFALEADIHLNRTLALVIRSEKRPSG